MTDYRDQVEERRAQKRVEAIERQRAIVTQKQKAVDAQKDVLDVAKKDYERALARLLDLTEKPDQETLFEWAEANGWKLVPTQHAIDARLCEKLEEGAGIRTLGDLVKFQEQNQLTDLAGIGPEAAGKIGEQVMQFYADHPEYMGESDDDPKELPEE